MCRCTLVALGGPGSASAIHGPGIDGSMMLAAADLGIGSGHAGIRDLALARRLLGFPGDRSSAMLVSFGYPAGPITTTAAAAPTT